MQLTKQPAHIAIKRLSGSETFPAIHIYRMSRHPLSISFKALNLHLPRQSPQAVQRSGYFTATCIPFSSFTVSNTLWEHLFTQRPHPVQLLSTTQITLFLFFRLRYKPPSAHSRSTTPTQIYATFIAFLFLALMIP
jgi:hypothetical protein